MTDSHRFGWIGTTATLGTLLTLASLVYAGTYSGGTGTAEDPYRISSAEDLIALGQDTADFTKSFILTSDIDMSALSGTQFRIIGRFPQTSAFSGIFDGNGHVIRNLTYTKNDYLSRDFPRAGLFGRLDSKGELRNLGVENISILCSEVLCLGGLVGENLGRISGCYTTGSVSGIADSIGGLVGADFGKITDSYSDCMVIGNKEVGGLAGFIQFSLSRCYATGSVTGTGNFSKVGGLVGHNAGWLTSCHATSSVSGARYTGGLVGATSGVGRMTHCFAAGAVNPEGFSVGGIVGAHGSVSSIACFWDITTSGLTSGVGNQDPDPSGVTGIDTTQMKKLATFTDAGWDFVGEAANGTEDVWRMCIDGVDYPRLSWEFSQNGDFDCPDGVALEDLLYLSQRWLAGTSETAGAADGNSDGKVDLQDLSLVSDHWLKDRGPITLEVYSDGWGTLIKTFTVAEEGEHKLKIVENRPYYNPSQYFIYAYRKGYFTEQYLCTAEKSPEPFTEDYWITVNVDLDPVKPGLCNGTIFLTQYFFHSSPLDRIKVRVMQEEGTIVEFQTDAQGRFSADILPGSHLFEFTVPGDSTLYVEPVVIDGPYQDIRIVNHIIAFKPNIYLYPQTATDLQVRIAFPYGGRVVSSIPEYDDGWNITATPSGLIDGQYGYLFYESVQGDRCQYQRGWIIGREDLGDFFRENLEITGFNDIEINDFLSYWIPRLDEFPYYAIYPQYNADLERINELEFSVRPDSILRLFYAIRGLETGNIVLPAPEIPATEQTGFVVREWGVMLK